MGFENFSCGYLTVAVQQQPRERERKQTVNGRCTLVLQRRAYMGHAYVQLRALVFGRSLGIAVEVEAEEANVENERGTKQEVAYHESSRTETSALIAGGERHVRERG